MEERREVERKVKKRLEKKVRKTKKGRDREGVRRINNNHKGCISEVLYQLLNRW